MTIDFGPSCQPQNDNNFLVILKRVFAKENHLSLELAARQVRYEFLNRVAVGKIATAHTASDNLETLIFNLSRGTALKGLCGIPPKRDNIIRPIICCTREDIENYCKNNDITFEMMKIKGYKNNKFTEEEYYKATREEAIRMRDELVSRLNK